MHVMKGKNRLLFTFTILLFSFVSSYGFNVCNVEFDEPLFEIKGEDGLSLLIIDNNGDIYARGEDHSLNNKNSYESFEVDSMHFNEKTSKYNTITQNAGSISNSDSLIINNSDGVFVASMKDNSIKTKGAAAIQGEQASCAPDGYYCNGDIRENRNYFCSITGDKSGSCTYNVLSSQDCTAKFSTETDSGWDYKNSGSVRDYTGCSSGNCISNIYSDVCTSSTSLKEYKAVGNNYDSTIKSCSDYNYRFCQGNDEVWKRTNDCSSGECGFSGNMFIKHCPVSETQYSTWSCSDSNTKVRTVTEFSPTCSTGSCGESSHTFTESQNCGGSQYCSSGNCRDYSYSWSTSSWGSCSASPSLECRNSDPKTGQCECIDSDPKTGECNQRNYRCVDQNGYQSRSVNCVIDQTGETVSDSYCSGSKPTTSRSCTQSCTGSVSPPSEDPKYG